MWTIFFVNFNYFYVHLQFALFNSQLNYYVNSMNSSSNEQYSSNVQTNISNKHETNSFELLVVWTTHELPSAVVQTNNYSLNEQYRSNGGIV